jgi:hypothetical protein
LLYYGLNVKEVLLLSVMPTIRTYLQQYIDENQISINKFSDVVGINAGTICNILSGNRPIAVQQLDRITAGMDLAEGHYYDLYIQECFDQESPDWRRLGPLLRRCAELNRLEDVELILRYTLDNLNYIPLLFDLAEQFFEEGKKEAAILLYENIAESERTQHSERLALCQYRLFLLRLNDDQENNLLVATYFEPFVERLDEDYQLDAITKLLNINISLNRWDKVEQNAEKLLNKALKQYKLFGNNNCNINTINPLIFYILYAYLEFGDVYFHLGQYSKALEYVEMYATANWIEDPDKKEKIIIKQFESWAVANRYMYQLMAGHIDILPEYVEYIAVRENEIFMGIYTILVVANQHKLDIDNILTRFSEHFLIKSYETPFSKKNEKVILSQYTDFTKQLALYYLRRNNPILGVDFLLNSLASAIKINNETEILQCMAIYEQHRYLASAQAQDTYKLLIKEVLELNEKKVGK